MQMRVLAVAALVMAAGTAFGQAEATKPAAAPKQPEAKAPAAATEKLKIGDKAPALTVEKWLKGQPVTGFEKGKVYVVEFWATWCGPCIGSMPHLSAIQKEYKDKVTIIGMTSLDKRGNTLEAATAMAKDKGDKMGYTVAWDTDRKTNDAYMKASGQGGIPCSFVVDGNGTIQYIGHPMFLDLVLEDVVAGKWDAKKGAEKIAVAEKAMGEVYKNMQNPGDAWTAWQKFEKEFPKIAHSMEDLKIGVLMANEKFDEVYKIWTKQVDTAIAEKDSATLNEVAWTIVDPAGELKKKDLDLALKAAKAGVEITKNADGMILDTLARVYFLKGETDKAIETQTLAIEKAPSQMKAQLQKALDEYKAKKDGK